MQLLTGQVYNLESDTFTRKNGEKAGEQGTWARFRLGMPKPYKTDKVINGVKTQVRESTFVTCKAFNGLAETIAQYFSGEENKGRYIQVFGHYEEEVFPRKMEIDHPDDPNSVLEIQVPTRELVFHVSHFSFVGEAPERKNNTKPQVTAGVKVKPKNAPAEGATPAPAAVGASASHITSAEELRGAVEPDLETPPF